MRKITPKNRQVRKLFLNFRRKNDFSKEFFIYYECKGRCLITKDCSNKKNKYKPKGKAMATIRDDDFDVLENEFQSSEEGA